MNFGFDLDSDLALQSLLHFRQHYADAVLYDILSVNRGRHHTSLQPQSRETMQDPSLSASCLMLV